ncbi:hypothetical protein CDD82_1114 [Ophiocordyceps australis]|uniref:Mtf2-like C-terminal domain-containing protein n=1 Tax=Ophiocordyceps australis TaxID=1399860 RepID=A0A2C5ZN82_9HYPO|nr:hypothetical protein CDD82_1114 [Ophiocordyceps australis]
MPPSSLSFLYHTPTIRQALRLATRSRPLAAASRNVHSDDKTGQSSYYRDNTVPFDWENSKLPPPVYGITPNRSSTLTPSEAEAFRAIFDEIANGQMPKSPRKKKTDSAQEVEQEATSKPAQAETDTGGDGFRQSLLASLPDSLRSAAEIALGVHTLPSDTPGQIHMVPLDKADQVDRELRTSHNKARASERQRIGNLLTDCRTDVALWEAMHKHVFTLPQRLNICNMSDPQKLTVLAHKPNEALGEANAPQGTEETLPVEIYGPLYPYLLRKSLALFEKAFDRPSPLAFYILPQVKALGPASYLLGVTKPLLIRLARMHWQQFGDADSALDVLEESNTACINVDDSFRRLLVAIRNQVRLCTGGVQSDVVQAVVKTAQYQKVVKERVEPMHKWAVEYIGERKKKGSRHSLL